MPGIGDGKWPGRPTALSGLVLHSEVAATLAAEHARQYTLSEVIAHRSELEGKTVWLRDDDKPRPGAYLIADRRTGRLEPLSNATGEEVIDSGSLVEIQEYDPRQHLAVDIDVLDVGLARIVVYTKSGLARTAGERARPCVR